MGLEADHSVPEKVWRECGPLQISEEQNPQRQRSRNRLSTQLQGAGLRIHSQETGDLGAEGAASDRQPMVEAQTQGTDTVAMGGPENKGRQAGCADGDRQI